MDIWGDEFLLNFFEVTINNRLFIIFQFMWDKRPERKEDDEFEITDTPPFDTPVVGWNPDPEEDEPIDEDEFDQEFTV
jgi:S-DNA-T family DNA segregation ATPase FtsK/SpoIIIE